MPKLTFQGRVQSGEGYASQLGCPTANIALEQGGVIPGLGVYTATTEYQGVLYPSLVCISTGRRGTHLKMEVHLLDQCKDLQGAFLVVHLTGKLRDLVPFEGKEQMSEMIAKDIEEARNWFEKQTAES